MLNLLKSKLNRVKPTVIKDNINNVVSKHFLPANKEWKNSIYAFNKNTLKLLPTADKVLVRLLRGYFNSFNFELEKRVKLPRLRIWMRRFSTTRIFLSKAELKHTSDKVIITLYIYDGQKRYLEKKKLVNYLN